MCTWLLTLSFVYPCFASCIVEIIIMLYKLQGSLHNYILTSRSRSRERERERERERYFVLQGLKQELIFCFSLSRILFEMILSKHSLPDETTELGGIFELYYNK